MKVVEDDPPLEDDEVLVPVFGTLARRRWMLGVLGVAGVIAAGAWALTAGPEAALERAMERAIDCTNALYESGEGDPLDCRQRGLGLALARVLPWTREAALQQDADIEEIVVSDLLKVAAVRELDADARDEAARWLIELDRADYAPQRRVFHSFGEASAAGALAVVAAMGGAGESANERGLAQRDALILGDWDAAGRIARAPLTPDPSFGDEYRRDAIVLCILGEREAAAGRLREADRAYIEAMGHPSDEVRLTELYCELPQSSKEPLKYEHQISALRRAQALSDPSQVVDAKVFEYAGNAERAQFIARSVLAADEPPDWSVERPGVGDALAALITPKYGGELEPSIARSAYEVPGVRDGLVFVDQIELAAKRLADLAELAPEQRGIDWDRRNEPAWRKVKIVEQPRHVLRWGAWCLATMAMAERSWRGQLDEARANLELAKTIAAAGQFTLFEILPLGHVARLDPASALAIVDSIATDELAALPIAQQVLLRTQIALVLDDAGRAEDALAMAASALEFGPRISGNDRVQARILLGARWVHASLLHRTGDPSMLQFDGGLDPRDLLTSEQLFEFWWAAALADPGEKAGCRWRSGGKSGLGFDLEPWFQPIVLETLALSAPQDRREVWLDAVSGDFYGQDPLTIIRTRADAAERLGDAVAAERWRARETRLLSRLQDDRAAALYRLY